MRWQQLEECRMLSDAIRTYEVKRLTEAQRPEFSRRLGWGAFFTTATSLSLNLCKGIGMFVGYQSQVLLQSYASTWGIFLVSPRLPDAVVRRYDLSMLKDKAGSAVAHSDLPWVVCWIKAGHVPIGTANYSSQWPVPGMLRLACVVWRLGVEQAASDWPGACSRSSAHARRSVCDKPTSEVSGWLCLLSFYASFFLSFTSVYISSVFFAFLQLPDFLHFGCRNHEGNIFMSFGSRSVCLRSLFSRLLCLAQDLQIAFGLGCFCHAPRENHRWAVEPLM